MPDSEQTKIGKLETSMCNIEKRLDEFKKDSDKKHEKVEEWFSKMMDTLDRRHEDYKNRFVSKTELGLTLTPIEEAVRSYKNDKANLIKRYSDVIWKIATGIILAAVGYQQFFN